MQESASILSPAGFIIDVGVVAPVNGTGTMGQQYVAPLLPGGAFHTRGTGTFDLSDKMVSGRQGALSVTLTTGTAGSAQAVALLALSPTAMLGIALDTSNRPYALLKDVFGTTVGQSKPLSTAIAAGVPLTITLSWNSQGVVFGGRFASFTVGGVVTDWTISPVAAWSWLTPSLLHIGTSLGALGLSNFTGTIGIVQLGSQVVAPPAGSDTAETVAETSTMAGSAAVSASIVRKTPVTSAMAGSAAVSASATVTGP